MMRFSRRGFATAAKRALIVCPGRGSYNSSELATMQRLPFRGEWSDLVKTADEKCAAAGLSTITDLDSSKKFSRDVHLEAAQQCPSLLQYADEVLGVLRDQPICELQNDARLSVIDRGALAQGLAWVTGHANVQEPRRLCGKRLALRQPNA